MCHCLACQRRTGSAFGIQARFPADRVRVVGRYADYVRISDWGEQRTFHFCPDCGATVFYTTATQPDLVAVPVGAFADPSFPPPTVSVYESRRHAWISLPDAMQHEDEPLGAELWVPLRPLYESGQYAEAADRGREPIEAALYPEPLYNLACCESLAGRTSDAIEHLRLAIDQSEQLRSLAATDSDFDPIREEPSFKELVIQ